MGEQLSGTEIWTRISLMGLITTGRDGNDGGVQASNNVSAYLSVFKHKRSVTTH